LSLAQPFYSRNWKPLLFIIRKPLLFISRWPLSF
jgi:hypothetical protein